MNEHPDESRIEGRANLLPEEAGLGTDDAHRQAEIILEDSDERTAHSEETGHEPSQPPD